MGDVRQDEIIAHEALREAFCNCLIHCQYRMLEDLLMTCGRNLKLVLPLRPKDISQTSQTSEKTSEKTGKKTSETILEIILENPRITVKELSQLTGLSVGGVRWNLDKLADKGRLKRVGPDKGGYWEVINKE